MVKNRLLISIGVAALVLVALAAGTTSYGQEPAPVMVVTPQDPPAPPPPPKAGAEAKLRQKLTEVQRQTELLALAQDGRRRDLERELAGMPEDLEAELHGLEHELRARAEAMAALAEEAQQAGRVFVDAWGGGWLGVGIAEVTAEKARELRLPAERGVLITEVQEDSPAAKAGLKVNDVVTDFNGQRVEGAVQFTRMVRETPAGRSAQITVWRDGRSQTLTAEIGSLESMIERRVLVVPPRMPEMPRFELRIPEMGGAFMSSRTPLLGIQAEDVRGQFGEFLGAPEGEGVLVREVREDSPAAKAGMRAGDVIFEAAGKRVRTLGELRSALREKREEKSVALKVARRGQQVTLNVEIEQPKPPAERVRPARRVSI
jgi:serine protease Do